MLTKKKISGLGLQDVQFLNLLATPAVSILKPIGRILQTYTAQKKILGLRCVIIMSFACQLGVDLALAQNLGDSQDARHWSLLVLGGGGTN
jgi:hypothetical protein